MDSNSTSVYLTNGQSYELGILIYNINTVYLMTMVSLFGVLSNAINICVFVKQGFRDKVNISLFALAASDLGTLLSSLVYSVCSNPLLVGAGLPVALYEVKSVMGNIPQATFSRITNCVTTYITFERCMCVVFPIKVKRIITARVTVVTLVLIYLAFASTVIKPYLGFGLSWRFDPLSNRTILGMSIAGSSGPDDLNAVLNLHTTVQLATFVLITLFTAVMIFELRRQSKWRQGTAQTNEASSKVAKRKVRKTIRMIAAMAVIYIAFYSLTVVHLIYIAVEPSYATSLYGVLIVLSSVMLMESINSSVGIFLYLAMSVKYRTTFTRMFCPCSPSIKSPVTYTTTSFTD